MIRVNYGVVSLEPFRLPPNIAIWTNGTTCALDLLRGRRDKKERKWLAACLIMGQPFNTISRQNE